MSSQSNAQRDQQREIITINCGGCGVNVGSKLLEQFTAEAGISIFGEKECKTSYDSSMGILFDEQINHKFLSRSLFIDNDPSSMQNIKRRYDYRSLIPPKSLISGKEDCSFNYAAAYYGAAKEIMTTVDEQLRALAESCDNIQGFLLNHSMAGGTGSGLTARILEKLAADYRKKAVFAASVLFPFEYIKGSPSSYIYNTLLYTDCSLEHTAIDVVLDNEAIHRMCEDHLKLQHPKYANYNRFIAKLVGDLTATSRFGINETFDSLTMDMVPFPRLHFLAASMYPMLPRDRRNVRLTPQELVDMSLNQNSHSVYIPDFNTEEDKHMATSFTIRGDDIAQQVSTTGAAMNWLLNNRKMAYVEWATANPMMKLVNNAKAKQLPDDDMLVTDRQCSMMMNNTAMSRVFADRFVKRFDILWSKRSYVHHYTSQGMEKGELMEAREDLGFLAKDYLDVLSEVDSEDGSDY